VCLIQTERGQALILRPHLQSDFVLFGLLVHAPHLHAWLLDLPTEEVRGVDWTELVVAICVCVARFSSLFGVHMFNKAMLDADTGGRPARRRHGACLGAFC
jgi:hypothetical protein